MGLLSAFSGNPQFQQQLAAIQNQQSPGYQQVMHTPLPTQMQMQQAPMGGGGASRSPLGGIGAGGGLLGGLGLAGLSPQILNLLQQTQNPMQQQNPMLGQQTGVQPMLGMSR